MNAYETASLIAGLVAVVALIGSIVDTWRTNRRRAMLDLVGFAVALTVCLVCYVRSEADDPDRAAKMRFAAALEASQKELRQAVPNVYAVFATARLGGIKPAMPPEIPKGFRSLTRDPDAYRLLSEPLKEYLPGVGRSLNTYLSALASDAAKEPQRTTYAYVYLDCAVLELALNLERKLHSGALTEKSHARRLGAAVQFRNRMLASPVVDARDDFGYQFYDEVSEEELAANLFALGRDFHGCVAAVNREGAPDDADDELLDRAQERCRRIGLALDLRRLFAEAPPTSQRYAEVVGMVEDALIAFYDDPGMTTFTFGLTFDKQCDTFLSYVSDRDYRNKFLDEGRRIADEGEVTNSNIDEILLPKELKRPWGHIYGGVMIGAPGVGDELKAWREAVLAHYGRIKPLRAEPLSGGDGG
jgi:hypothetical protein